MNELINVNDIKNGMTVFYNGNICQIQSFLHVKPGKGAAIMKVKMRNLKTGTITEESINSNVKIEKAHVDKKKMVYLYNSGSSYVFMDNETYEQIEITPDKISTAEKYLKENLEVQIDFYEGDIIGIKKKEKIEYEIVETTDAVKGNTTNNAMKDATLDNGLVVKVPMFINQGERIIVTTEDGKYSSRA